MNYRKLGRTGLQVSEVGFGAWAIGGPAKLGDKNIGWGPVDDKESQKALLAAFNAGINFYDTADVYGWGHSEDVIGKTFKGKREKIIIASKVGNRVDESGNWIKDFSEKWVRQAVEASLRRLQTDYIDFYQLHSPHEDFEYTHKTFDVFEDLKKEGKIRYYGVSVGRAEHGLAVAKLDKGDAFQVVYNIFKREPEDELFAVAKEQNLGIIARVPLASGFLSGKFNKNHKFHPEDHRANKTNEELEQVIEQVDRLSFLKNENRTLAQAALQFCLTPDVVSTVIPGARTVAQAQTNALASELGRLSHKELELIEQAVG